MSVSIEIPQSVFLSSSDVGDGNPSCYYAIASDLSERGVSVTKQMLSFSSIPGKLFQKAVSASSTIARGYTEKGESVRGGVALYAYGILSAAEMLYRHPENFFGQPNPSGVGIFVQEHQLGALTQKQMEKMFPGGSYLVVSDVMPKKSGMTVMERTGVRPLTWACSTFNTLQEQGFDPVLTTPFLPYGFFKTEQKPIQGEHDYILVKAPGAGISPQELKYLYEALLFIQKDFLMFMPDRIITSRGGVVSDMNKEDRLELFYKYLVSCPPAMFIAHPSEQVQVAAALQQQGWGGHYYALPARGEHEANSYEWGVEHDVISGKMNIGSAVSMTEQIWNVFKADRHDNRAICKQLGQTSLYEAVFPPRV